MKIAVLADKRLVVGVSGSIAAYKAADLASKLTQAGALVDIILTESAQRFVSPLTFRSVTGRPVYTDMWAEGEHVAHVRLGEAADLLVIAPATAQTMARLAHGLADNLLALTALAARCPMLLAPAMDGGMFEHAATQANLETLRQRGALVAGPAVGRMASGLMGVGRMLEPEELVGHIRLALGQQGALRGRRVVVTAGPTREVIDPVRYLSNHSSGKQGVALAQAALDAGAQVTLIAGPIAGATPVGAKVRPVESAAAMKAAVLAAVGGADALLMAAAVADFRPEAAAEQKMKKGEMGERPAIYLARNEDILEAVQARKKQSGCPRVTVGFAAETQNAVEYGRDKLQRKGLDLIVVNDVSAADAGFAVDTNRVVVLDAAGGVEELPLLSKTAVAERIVERVAVALAGCDRP